MPMITRCGGDLTTVTRDDCGWLRYEVAAPLATYTGTVTSIHDALFFALTGYYPEELDDVVSLDPADLA